MPESAFHAVAIVVAEGLSDRTNPVQRRMRADLDEAVSTALMESSVDPARIEREDREDGILLLDPTVSVLALAGRFVRELDEGLREKARTSAPVARVRVRMALSEGACEYDGERWSGTAVDTAVLLVEAAPLRDTLAAADRANMALIVSRQVFDGVIRHDYRTVDSSTFERVAIDTGDSPDETAWIQVPGYTYPPVVTPAPPGPKLPGSARPGSASKAERAKRRKDQPTQRGIIFNGTANVKVEGDFVNEKSVNRGNR